MASIIVEQPASTNHTHRGQTFVLDTDAVHIPAWVVDHASFRRWFHSDDFPENKTRICYLHGEVWVDMSKEQLFTHNKLKGEISRVLLNFLEENPVGHFFLDGVLLTNTEAELTSQPAGTFVSEESLQKGYVRWVEGVKQGFVEMEGTPDMVLEVVSDSSVHKDKEILMDLYHRAGIPEYWLVDARGEELEFDILRHTKKGYVAARQQKGWVKSKIFGRAVQLVAETDKGGNPKYTLRMK
jgi:Uma2 family endonuclease